MLALACRRLRGRLSPRRSANLTAARELLTSSRRRSLAALALFALSPIPSAQLFEAVGLMGVPLRPVVGVFFTSRIVRYSMYVGGATALRHTEAGRILSGSIDRSVGNCGSGSVPRRRGGPGACRLGGMSHPPAAVERGPPSHLTDHFDLPRSVQLRVASSDDAVALLRAFLEAGGRTVRVEEPPIRAGDEAVAVVPASFGRPVTHRELNAAFRTFEAIGAARGLVITPGSSPTGEARRRELFAPTLRHVGPGAIQRMADAVTLGADPLEFAVGVPCQSAG